MINNDPPEVREIASKAMLCIFSAKDDDDFLFLTKLSDDELLEELNRRGSEEFFKNLHENDK